MKKTLIIRTKEDLHAIKSRMQSGDWVLTDKKKIKALENGGTLIIHPITNGRYKTVLKAVITDITKANREPLRRKIIHFKDAELLPADTIYKTQWVVKFI